MSTDPAQGEEMTPDVIDGLNAYETADARERILIGKDTDDLTTALSRLYRFEHECSENLGYRPDWLIELRQLLEDILREGEC